MDNIKDRVVKIIVDQLSLTPEEVNMDSSFVDDLGADSLDQVELVLALEEEFDISIPDEEAEKITTVTQAINKIESALTEKTGLARREYLEKKKPLKV